MLLYLPPWGGCIPACNGAVGFLPLDPGGVHPLGKNPLVEMTIEVGKTHSIRMHSCSNLQPLV